MAVRRSIARDKARERLRSERAVVQSKARGRRVMHPATLRASFDAAQTTNSNARWWANSDALSARSANSSGVRQVLRNRSRYELANNGWGSGIMRTLANHVIGRGPRLQMTSLPGPLADEVERKFIEWAEEVQWPQLLWQMRSTRMRDGEAFCILHNNPNLENGITLFPRTYEGDQIATPFYAWLPEDNAVDGIVFDEYGLPKIYHLLDHHPGSLGYFAAAEKQDIEARYVVHEFISERPGQARGIPEITPTLPLFAMLRDFGLATLDAAKAAAYHASVIYSDVLPAANSFNEQPPADDVDLAALDTIALDRNMATTLPKGWKLGQVKAEHPGATYEKFVDKTLNELARPINMPFNIAAANSADYNYASGRLDHQTYFQFIQVDRKMIETVNLNRTFKEWKRQAILTEGFLSQALRMTDTDWRHVWQWDGFGHVDPTKEARGQELRLKNETTNTAIECAKEGLDWEEVQDGAIRAELRGVQRRKEIAKEMGLILQSNAGVE